MSNLSVTLNGKIGNLFLNFEHHFKNDGITILYGPNGSGKTTIISALGGFINNIETRILFNGNEIHDIFKYPPNKRPFGIMFQNPILFEHLSVEENLDFVLKRNQLNTQNKSLISKEYLINKLELNSLLKRSPENLSGGEKLRVVLARTILKHPNYLLLDEPMSDLDIKYKAKLLVFLKDFNKKFKIPILYITHSIEEISQIGDQIVLIKDGKKIKKNKVIAEIKAKTKTILKAERTALNFLNHASGIATLTNRYVKKINKKTKICCTRKTTPNLRLLEKYAVKKGGGFNHRYNLSDEILIKDNHINAENNLLTIHYPSDINNDGSWDILDILLTINFIMDQIEPTPEQNFLADMNQDGIINILDIISMVNLILNQ